MVRIDDYRKIAAPAKTISCSIHRCVKNLPYPGLPIPLVAAKVDDSIAASGLRSNTFTPNSFRPCMFYSG